MLQLLQPPGWHGRPLYHAKTLRSDPTALIGIILIGLLVYLVVGPVLSLASNGVMVQPGDETRVGAETGSLTTYYLERVFTSMVSAATFWQPLGRTLLVAGGTTVLALSLGASLAWLLVRTDLPGSRLFGNLLFLPYILPTWTFALAWLTIFKNRRIGGPTGYAEAMGFSPPDWIAYGPTPMIIALGLSYFPLFLLLIGNALRRFDSQLEESAQMLGASRRVIAWRIIMPLMLPATMSGILLTTSRALGTFGAPYILGLPVNYTVLSTSLFRSFETRQPGTTAVLASVIIILGVGIVAMDAWVLRNQRRFVTVGGKGSMRRPVLLGKWRTPLTLLVSAVVAVTTLVPLAALALSTVMISPGVYERANFTLRYWIADFIETTPGFPQGLLRNPELIDAAWNSLRVAGIAAVICGVLGLLSGYVVVRLGGTRLSSWVRQLSFLPYLIPGVAFGAAYVTLFIVQRGPVPPLYGTLLLLILAMTVAYLPFASRAGISAMMQLGHEPEEAAQMAGAGWFKRMSRIVIPLQKGPLLIGVILPFVSGMRELSLVIMLATRDSEVLSTLSIRLLDFSYNQHANGVVLIIVAIVFVATYVAQRVSGSDLASGLGS